MKSPLDPDNRPKLNLIQLLKIDPVLLLLTLILAAIGLLILYSASSQDLFFIKKQAIHYVIGFLLMLLIAQIKIENLQIVGLAMFFICLILLILVLFFGSSHKGAQRWLDLGVMQFQPSELMKIALPMMIAFYLSKGPMPAKPMHFLIASIIVLIPTALIIKQPDLGTSILIASSGIFVIFLAGISWNIILALIGAGVVVLPIFWTFFMAEYQKQRVITLFNPESDPLGSGYHIIQSKIAIGSGGIFGKGWLAGSQSQLEFLPEKHTDFIFAVLAEEFGFMGVLLLFVLFFLFVARILWISNKSTDIYCKLLAGSLGMTLCLYFFINVGMVSGILPVVGLPLPFISYGGTSLITLFVSLGLLMAIYSKIEQKDTKKQ